MKLTTKSIGGPALANFWEVFCTLNKAAGLKLALNPLLALFGKAGEDDKYIPRAKRRVLSFGSLLDRRAILMCADLMSCLSLEKIHCSTQNQKGTFDQICGLFLENFSKLQLKDVPAD